MTVYKYREFSKGPFPVNQKLAGIVPMAVPSEQVTLFEDIRLRGQQEPVVLWKGQVVDGRCRQMALTQLKRDIMYRELDDELTEEEVKVWVKSMNTRRNLSLSQKIAVACKQYLEYKNDTTVADTAEAWGVGVAVLHNALWIHKQDPAVIETIFNGGTVRIEDRHGRSVDSNKITTIYAYYRRKEENAVENVDHGWKADSFIKTQAGKDWYYRQLELISNPEPHTRYLIAELANFKFAASN